MAIETLVKEIEAAGLTTEKGVLAVLALALGLEIWTLSNERQNDTISEIIWGIRNDQPWAVFLAGFLAGHLFW